jgi:hypothetical protein
MRAGSLPEPISNEKAATMRDEEEIREAICQALADCRNGSSLIPTFHDLADAAMSVIRPSLLAQHNRADVEHKRAEMWKTEERIARQRLGDELTKAENYRDELREQVARLSIERNQAHDERDAYKQAWTRLSNVVKGQTVTVHDPREAVYKIETLLRAALAAAGAPTAHGQDCGRRLGELCMGCGCWCHMNPDLIAGAPKEGSDES